MPAGPRPPAERTATAAGSPWAGVLVAGALLGAACLLTDWLQSDLTPLGQLVSPWVLVAAWAGSRGRSGLVAAALGTASLLAATSVYYLGGALAAASLSRALMWTAVACAVGPLAGVGGAQARRGPRPLQAPALGLLATVAVAEAVVRWQHVRAERTAVVFVAVVVTAGCCLLAEARTPGRGPGRAASSVLLVVALAAVPSSLVLEGLLGAVGVITT